MPLPYWYWDKQVLETDTPSIQDGLDYSTECQYRKEGAKFILDSGLQLELGYKTLATGVVFFHRFYMFHSFKMFPPHVTACCCLYLAGKVEETPKRCKDIIKIAKSLLDEEQFSSFGKDPVEEVMALERILLQTIKFDLKVQHPYSYLTKYVKCLKGPKELIQQVLQAAWNFVNDSLRTTLCIQWEPEIIAIAVIHLAGKMWKFKVTNWVGKQPEHLHWWDMFVQDLSVELLEDICHQILDLYPQPTFKETEKSKTPAQTVKSNTDQPVKSTVANHSPPSETKTNPNFINPPREPKIETAPTYNHSQFNVPETPNTSASWTPMSSFPPPPDNALHSSFIVPNMNVPPPPSYSPFGNSTMPPTSSPFPMTNLSVPPPSHAPFPPTNLSIPPPMINSSNYYGTEHYLRYQQ